MLNASFTFSFLPISGLYWTSLMYDICWGCLSFLGIGRCKCSSLSLNIISIFGNELAYFDIFFFLLYTTPDAFWRAMYMFQYILGWRGGVYTWFMDEKKENSKLMELLYCLYWSLFFSLCIQVLMLFWELFYVSMYTGLKGAMCMNGLWMKIRVKYTYWSAILLIFTCFSLVLYTTPDALLWARELCRRQEIIFIVQGWWNSAAVWIPLDLLFFLLCVRF